MMFKFADEPINSNGDDLVLPVIVNPSQKERQLFSLKTTQPCDKTVMRRFTDPDTDEVNIMLS